MPSKIFLKRSHWLKNHATSLPSPHRTMAHTISRRHTGFDQKNPRPNISDKVWTWSRDKAMHLKQLDQPGRQRHHSQTAQPHSNSHDTP